MIVDLLGELDFFSIPRISTVTVIAFKLNLHPMRPDTCAALAMSFPYRVIYTCYIVTVIIIIIIISLSFTTTEL